MITIDEYIDRYARSRTTDAADVILRSLPEAIALWRSEQQEPLTPLTKEMLMIDAATGIVEIVDGNAEVSASPVSENDDVKAFGEIATELLRQMPYTNHRVTQLVQDCRAGKYATMGDVMLAVEKRRSNVLYIVIIAAIALLLALLALLALLNHTTIE